MSKGKEWLAKIRHPKGLILLAAVFFVAINLSLFIFYVLPAISHNQQISEEHDRKHNEWQTIVAQTVPDSVSEEEISELLAKVPTGTKLHQLTSELNELALRRGMMLTSIRMENASSSESDIDVIQMLEPTQQSTKAKDSLPAFLHKDQFGITIVGYLDALIGFIQDLDQLERIVELDSWSYSIMRSDESPFLQFAADRNMLIENKVIYEASVNLNAFSMPQLKQVFASDQDEESAPDPEEAIQRINRISATASPKNQ